MTNITMYVRSSTIIALFLDAIDHRKKNLLNNDIFLRVLLTSIKQIFRYFLRFCNLLTVFRANSFLRVIVTTLVKQQSFCNDDNTTIHRGRIVDLRSSYPEREHRKCHVRILTNQATRILFVLESSYKLASELCHYQ